MIYKMYQVKKIPNSEFVPLRQLNYHVQVWGNPAPDKTPLVLLHGWMDVAASFQFVVDALRHDHFVIAPDWRGFGQTSTGTAGPPQGADGPLGGQRSVGAYSGGVDSFWFPDYLADLDCLLDHFAPGTQVNLVGHSMGGNVAMLYAGVRPERIRRLVNLEGFGMPATTPDEAPGRFAHWMNELKTLRRGEMVLKGYDSAASVAQRLMKNNPRLGQDKAQWLATHWAREDADGQWRILGEPAHKVINAQLYRLDEVLEIYRCISMPVLMVEASDDSMSVWWKGKFTLAQHRTRLQAVAQVEIACVENAGHMLHHDQPEVLAALIERFIG